MITFSGRVATRTTLGALGGAPPPGSGVLIVGLTPDDLNQLAAGGELVVNPADRGLAGPNVHLVCGPSHGAIRRRLAAQNARQQGSGG